MSVTLYQYPKCDTCRKASAWLKKHGIAFEAPDLVAGPPSAEELRTYWQRSGRPLQAFFNTSGESYRKGGFKDRLPAMSEAAQLQALAADGKLIKRPLLVVQRGGEARVLVGFDEKAYAELLGAGAPAKR